MSKGKRKVSKKVKKIPRYYGFADTLEPKCAAKYLKQLNKRGIDDTESWSLGPYTFTSFIYLRLKEFAHTYRREELPSPETEWEVESNEEVVNFNSKLDKALETFAFLYDREVVKEDVSYTVAELEEIQKGLEAFAYVYMGLWN